MNNTEKQLKNYKILSLVLFLTLVAIMIFGMPNYLNDNVTEATKSLRD